MLNTELERRIVLIVSDDLLPTETDATYPFDEEWIVAQDMLETSISGKLSRLGVDQLEKTSYLSELGSGLDDLGNGAFSHQEIFAAGRRVSIGYILQVFKAALRVVGHFEGGEVLVRVGLSFNLYDVQQNEVLSETLQKEARVREPSGRDAFTLMVEEASDSITQVTVSLALR